MRVAIYTRPFLNSHANEKAWGRGYVAIDCILPFFLSVRFDDFFLANGAMAQRNLFFSLLVLDLVYFLAEKDGEELETTSCFVGITSYVQQEVLKLTVLLLAILQLCHALDTVLITEAEHQSRNSGAIPFLSSGTNKTTNKLVALQTAEASFTKTTPQSTPVSAIDTTISHPDLGVTMSGSLNWSLHYNVLCSKAYRILGLLRHLFSPSCSVQAKKLL